MTGFRGVAAVLGLAFAALLVWGFAVGGSVVPLLTTLLAAPWGVVTLADLYLGFVLVAGIIVVLEPNRGTGVAWGIGVVVFGNIVTAAWIVMRLPAAVQRLQAGR